MGHNLNIHVLEKPVSYQEALDLQLQSRRNLAAAKHQGELFILEHNPPVVTVGRNKGIAELRITEDELKKRGYDLFRINRGGSITMHEPGQVVLYIVAEVKSKNVSEFINAFVKPAALCLYEEYRQRVIFEQNRPGLWLNRRKIASIGLDLTGGISMHGMAINVNNSLEGFQLINPCGMESSVITSLEKETGCLFDLQHMKMMLKKYYTDI